jgi:starvation-inducible DNA-binding protein
MNMTDSSERRAPPPQTTTGLGPEARRDITGVLNLLLADVYALYIKTKNFYWHVSGPHFRDYHLLLDEQSGQIFAIADTVAERVRKIGGTTLRSIAHIARLKRVLDNDAYYVTPLAMLAELRDDNKDLAAHMREAHSLCGKHGDVPTASLLAAWIDEAERRVWFLFEASRVGVISDADAKSYFSQKRTFPACPENNPVLRSTVS